MAMKVVYDIGKSPATHDFVNWLARVEKLRIARQEEELEVIIVPGDRQYSARDLEYSREKKLWRVNNLLFPLSRCLPSVKSVSLGSGEQTVDYTNFGRPQRPVLKAPLEARRIVSSYLKDCKNPVSITLRQSDFEIERNSRLEEWGKVSRWLINNGFTPIIIPDAEALMRSSIYPLPVGEHYFAASLMPELLLALYEQCTMNLMTTGGRMVLALFSQVPLMAFKLIIPSLPCCTENHMRISGMAEDDDWGPLKQLFWKDDLMENILPELERMKEPVYA